MMTSVLRLSLCFFIISLMFIDLTRAESPADPVSDPIHSDLDSKAPEASHTRAKRWGRWGYGGGWGRGMGWGRGFGGGWGMRPWGMGMYRPWGMGMYRPWGMGYGMGMMGMGWPMFG